MNSKLIGGILLVIGTTIGAGMLALPVATAELGFWGSILLLTGAWLVMVICSFLFIEVTLWLPPNTNLISMAGMTLGRSGQTVSWLVYSVLLYSIICAYIDGGGDLTRYLLSSTIGIEISLSAAKILFAAIFGSIVYCGIRLVDYVNRVLMFGKMGAYVLLVLFIMPYVIGTNLNSVDFSQFFASRGLTTTSLAFASLMIIPSLRTYFGEDNIKSLRIAVFVGITIPLICYIAWDMVILGVIPLQGTTGLQGMMNSATPNSDLVAAIGVLLQSPTVTMIAKFFTSICMTTSFLSISLCLSDFLADGFNMQKRGLPGILIFLLTFMPPLLIVLFYPNGFQKGIEYAGVCCFILMLLLPPLMVWRGRYHLNYPADANTVPGGKLLLSFLLVCAVMLIAYGFNGLYPSLSVKLLVAPPAIFATLVLLVGMDRGRGKRVSAQA